MIKKSVLYILLSIHLISSNLVYSQTPKDFLYINFTPIPKSEFKDKNIESNLNQFDFNVVTPTIKLSSKTKFNTIVYYRLSQYDFTTSPIINSDFPSQLHELRLSLLTRHIFNDKWELIFVPRFSMRSDFKASLSEKDFFPAVTSIFMKTSQKNKLLKWGFGVNYNNDLGKNSIIPIITFNYSNDKMRFTSYLPNNANLVFTSIKKTEFGLAYNADPTITHINTSDSIEYIRTLNASISPTFSYNLTSNFWMNIKAGWMFTRNFDLYNNYFEIPSSGFENSFKSTAFAQIGISLRSKE